MTNLLLLAALPVWWVDPYGDDPILPDAPPKHGISTNVISCAAARGEIESVSFAVRPTGDLQKVNFVPSALTGPGGATIPATNADMRLVKVWYRAGGRWGTSWCGRNEKPELIPDLLLHDEGFVKNIDAERRGGDAASTNDYRSILLRFRYPDGDRYVDMRKHSGGETHFLHEVHPVRDAPRFVPIDLKANRTQQFWLTWKIPENATPGLYRGTLAVSAGNPSADGRSVIDLPIEVEVYPFALPQPRTHYDTSRPFIESWMGVPTLEGEVKYSHDLAKSERKVRAIYRSLAEHNVHVPNGPGTFTTNSLSDLAVRSLVLMREEGMRCETIINGSALDADWCAAHYGAKFTPPEKNPDAFVAATNRYAKMLDLQRDVLDTWLGHHNCYLQSADECGTALNRRSYAFWGLLRERGFESWTDYGVAEDIGWSVGMNDEPASARHTSAWKWRKRGDARVVSYAGTFSGPACPDIWRRKGLRYYYADFDGLHEYCFFYNRWNHWDDFHYRGSYAQMQIVYLTEDGLIPTLAWEGVREALDDIRYLSLLRLRAEAAIRSKDVATHRLGRRHLAWMDARDPEFVVDLFAFRKEVAKRICELPPVDAKMPPPVDAESLPRQSKNETPLFCRRGVSPRPHEKPIAPHVTRRDAASTENGAAVAENGAAVAEKGAAVAEKGAASTENGAASTENDAASTEERVAAIFARVKVLSEIYRRDEALKLIDEALARRDVIGALRKKLQFLRVKTMMTDGYYAETYSEERLAAAEEALWAALSCRRDVSSRPHEKPIAPHVTRRDAASTSEAFDAILCYLKACRAGSAPARAVAFADSLLKNAKFNDHRRGMILLQTALAERERGDDHAASKRYCRARKSCNCATCFPRDLLKEEGALHERLGEWQDALEAYTQELKRYDRVEEKDLIRRCTARVANVMKHVREEDREAPPEDDKPLIDLDE